MKPLSLEGLRRLVRGGRDKRDQSGANGDAGGQTFRRSNSFKRASLRRSARRLEKITLPNGLVVKTSALQRKSSVSSDERRDDGYSTDGGEGTGSTSTGRRGFISYDEWRVTVCDEEPFARGRTDESLQSTLSTNKLSSLDSGVRHSLDSKKKLSVNSDNKRMSLDRRKTLGVDMRGMNGPAPPQVYETRRYNEPHSFRRSVSADSPVPTARIKSILGSPRIAPKTQEPPTTPARSLHNTPSRSRTSVAASAPSTPGRNQVHTLTPTHQLRASWHERETRRCTVYAPPPSSPQLLRSEAKSSSPKPQSRWSQMFSGTFFSRSPSRKSQHSVQSQKVQKQQEHQQILQKYALPQTPTRQVLPQTPVRGQTLPQTPPPHQQQQQKEGPPTPQRVQSLYRQQGSPALNRQRSIQSCESPSLVRHCNYPNGGPVSLDYGVARAMGGAPRSRSEDSAGPRSLGPPVPAHGSPSLRRISMEQQHHLPGSPSLRRLSNDAPPPLPASPSPLARNLANGSPSPLFRHLSHEPTLPGSPSPLIRHLSHEPRLPPSPLARRSSNEPRTGGSPSPLVRHFNEPPPLPASPSPLVRHLSHEPPMPGSPSPLVRQLSYEHSLHGSPSLVRHRSMGPEVQSPVFRPRPLSSPPTSHSPKTVQVLGETPNMANSSQFYPGRLGGGMITGLPSTSTVGRPPSVERSSPSRQSSQERVVPGFPSVPSYLPRTPVPKVRQAVQQGRPLSLIMASSRLAPDLISPASMTSEASSRGRRRRKPNLLVGRVSWLARAAYARRSGRLSRKAKKEAKKKAAEEEEMYERPPARLLGRPLGPEVYQGLRGDPHYDYPPDGMVFVPPQRRNSQASIRITQDLFLSRVEVPEIRTAHAHLLMPLNQPVGSHMIDGRSQKANQLVRTMMDEEDYQYQNIQQHKSLTTLDEYESDYEPVRDTCSEPGGKKFSVMGFGGGNKKPKSQPSTTRLKLRLTRNPEFLLKALGLPFKIGKNKEIQPSPSEEVNETLITQILLESLTRNSSKQQQQNSTSAGSGRGSAESLVESIVSKASSSGTGGVRSNRKVRRKKSARKPGVPTYPSWKRTPRSRAARKQNGDITQKGYEKKKNRILAPYAKQEASQGAGDQQQQQTTGVGSPSTRSRRRAHRRVTRNESRYHSEVRQEAVKEALAQYQSRPKNLPLPSKRSSVMTARSPDRHQRDSDSDDSDDDSVAAEGSLGSSGGHSGSQGTPEVSRAPLLLPPPQMGVLGGSGGGTPASSVSSVASHQTPPPHQMLSNKQQQPLPPVPPHSDNFHTRLSNGDEEERRRREMTEVTDLMRNITSFSAGPSQPPMQPPDVTNNTGGTNINNRAQSDDRITRHHRSQISGRQSSASDEWRDALYNFPENWRGTGRWKVSNKIQQLLNTLKRPKRRPLPEFYVDDEEDLEIAANPKDPNAPKPEGMVMTPARGEQLMIPSGLPRSVEDAVYRYGSSSGYKAPVATVLDANGKLSVSLTYGKLLSRSQKIAYNILNKLGGRGEGAIMPGDRVALVYPNNDPVSFLCSFYACLQAGLVPVPIEVPLSRRDAGSQQVGFLLGSCGVQVALTSEACFKGIPKTSAGEVVSFKGWPKLKWFMTDNLPKPPKEWQPPPRHTDDSPAYIEYTTDKDGSVKGVVVTRSAMLAHCRTLTSACNYTEGEVAVCVLDFKREVGLWHSMLCSVFNGMHVIFIPYSVMKVNPASWMHMITKFKASIAIVKSRDLHWGLLATKDHKDVNLSSLRLLLVADGANPWSLSSCDQFLAVFQSKGLRPDAICPCASSPEALTVSVRRPGHGGANAVGRGVLSMQGLSYGVVRVDQENSLTSLTLQDCGQVLPGAMIVVIKLDGSPYVCRTDEVGEICVSGSAVGSQYFGLQGMTNTTFKVQPLLPDNTLVTEQATYVRTGLLGFLGPGGLVFVCGSRDGLMTVTGRKHNTDDIIATVLAVEPMKFIYRGRIAVFSHKVLRDERICVIAEQRPDCSEEESFQWMSRVLQAVDSIHQVGIYCLALVPPNHLPKTPLGGIHLSETRKKFLEGSLHPANVLMCPHTCVTNLPKPREVHHGKDVGPASVMVGNLVQGNRLAEAQGRDIGPMDDEDGTRRHPQFIADILKWRANTTENHEILTLLNSKGQVATSLTCAQLHKKAERVGCLLLEKGHVNTGDHVALIYPPGVDLIAAFYGCLYVGAVPVTIRPPHPQNLQSTVNTVRTVVEVSKSCVVLSTLSVVKLLRSKEEKVDIGKKWPAVLETDDLPKKRLPSIYKAPTPEMIAYLDFSVSTTGMLAGIKISHAGATALCLSMKVACELYPSRVVALCLDPYCGLGFALWVLSSVYSGHQSILIPPSEVEVNPSLWVSAVSQYKVRDTFCSYGVMELCTKGLGSSINMLKQRSVNLSCVRTCVVVAEERPRVQLTNSFSKLFSGLGLSPRAVSTSFGCRTNVAICLQGASSPDPSTVFCDLRSLRHDRVTLVERGAPHSLCVIESGKLLPGVKVVIANPDTKGQCSDSHLGEIWVNCGHNASGYFTVYGDDGSANDHFNAKLVTGNTTESFARTGYLGFLRRTESIQADGELHDAVFVVGSLDETIMLRGMRYHPIDIETTVMRSHKKISEVAVFNWTNLLVVVVELDGQEYEALDLVPLITSSVLEEHQVIVGVIVVVDPGVVPINSRGEKQRMHLRDGFLADQLDPIYVAYNM